MTDLGHVQPAVIPVRPIDRSQFHHVIDIAATVLDVSGLPAPACRLAPRPKGPGVFALGPKIWLVGQGPGRSGLRALAAPRGRVDRWLALVGTAARV